MAEAFDGERVALDIIDLIVDKAALQLYENYITSREIPFAAGAVLVDVFDIVRTAFLKRDDGNLKPEEDSTWMAEKEPHSTQCDSWARGAVAVKKKPKVKKVKEEDKPKAGYGFRRVSTSKAKTKKKDKSDAFDDEDESEDVLIRTVGTPTESLELGAKRRNGDKELTPQEIANAKELQDIEDKEKAERERRQRMLEQEKAEIESHEKLVKELKGKDYTFDQNGNVILITPMSKDSLRPLQLNLGVSVTNLLHEEDKGKKGRKGKKGKKGKMGGGGTNSSMDQAASVQFFTSSVLQPSILSSVMLNPGVDITEGGKKKSGPRKKAPKDKMSRTDFLSHQSLLESKSSMVVGSASANPLSSSMSLDPNATTLGGAVGLQTSMSVPVLDNQAQVDNSAEIAQAEAKARAAKLAKIAKANQVLATHQPNPKDKNLLLTKSADWGANLRQKPEDFLPAPLAKQQNPKQKELQTKLMGGERVKNPRDRPFISSSPTARRQRLPPPPLGMTTGHGVATSGHDGMLPSIGGLGLDGSLSMSMSKPKSFKSVKQNLRGGKVVRGQTADLDPASY